MIQLTIRSHACIIPRFRRSCSNDARCVCAVPDIRRVESRFGLKKLSIADEGTNSLHVIEVQMRAATRVQDTHLDVFTTLCLFGIYTHRSVPPALASSPGLR